MNKAVTINLPAPVYAYAQSKAVEFGLSSPEEWIENELEWQRQMQLETDWFFAERSYGAKPRTLREILAKVPAAPSLPGDELPERRIQDR